MKGFSTASKIGVICFWILIWQVVAMLVHSPLLLASPLEVGGRLISLISTWPFWITIGNSFVRIISGFLLALIMGTIIAICAYWSKWVYIFISPLFSVIKAVPVASFIVMVLMWVNSSYLSTVVGFLIVLPIVFENVYFGLESVDKNLLEMSLVFKVPFRKQIKYLYMEQLIPSILTAVSVGVGFCFKSSVAAEVIGICRNTIGEAIYMAKITFETADVFAWTVVIVTLSVLTSKAAKTFVNSVRKDKGYDKTN